MGVRVVLCRGGCFLLIKVAAPVVKMTRLVSSIVHLASAAGDSRTLAVAGAYIFMRLVLLEKV